MFKIMSLFSHSVESDSATSWTQGFPVPHHLPKFAQETILCELNKQSDNIEPCHTPFQF